MAQLDWKNLPFGYTKTDYNVRCYFRDGKWGEIEVTSSEYIPIHMAASALHYGQEAFEGLKAFKGKDEKVRVFRWRDNAARLRTSSDGVCMAHVPDELFWQMISKAILLNKHFVPPYDSGASLYVRPLLIGSGAKVGVSPSDEYLLLVFVTPVGPYFKEGFKATNMVICREYDRAAPHGTGNIKVGGNYAASLRAGESAHHHGYSASIFLDAREKKYIDECGPANFFAIKGDTYITPKSSSILPSITNMSLITLVEEMGMKTERRIVAVEELDEFDEAGACGTAAVISPIFKIVDEELNKEYVYPDAPGPITTKLYHRLRAIQYGDAPDTHNWVSIVE